MSKGNIIKEKIRRIRELQRLIDQNLKIIENLAETET